LVLKAKGPVIARDLDCEIGEMIQRRNKSSGVTFINREKEKADAKL